MGDNAISNLIRASELAERCIERKCIERRNEQIIDNLQVRLYIFLENLGPVRFFSSSYFPKNLFALDWMDCRIQTFQEVHFFHVNFDIQKFSSF